MAIKKTKRNLRLKNKRRVTKKNRVTKKHVVTKKYRINKRTKKYFKKNMSKKRRSSKKIYQRGGLFNENESEQIRTKLKEIGFTDDNEIENIIADMSSISQQIGGKYFEELIEQMNTFTDTEEFKEWLKNIKINFEDKVETDSEDNSDSDDESDDNDDSDDEN